jgi:putative membrane protein
MRLSARPVRAIILLAWAAFFVSLWASGDADRYLGPRTTWVVPFGAITLSLAALGYGALALRGGSSRRVSRVEALGHFALLAPILAVLLVPQAELGAQAARKKDTNRNLALAQIGKAKKSEAQAATKAAAASKDEIAPIDFLSIASVTTDPGYAEQINVKPGTRVRFIGFAVQGGPAGTFQITRFLISCCAADAVPVMIAVDPGAQAVPPDDTWLDVTGRLATRQGSYVVEAESMRPVAAPSEPYLTFWG